MKILNVVGARPNFMKMAPIIRAINRHSEKLSQLLVHTGQHYDDQMAGTFFRDLEIPPPDITMNAGGGSHAQQTAKIMVAFETVLAEQQPDWVVVVGDVNSTLACALVASKLNVKIAHVEAGLRSFDRTMPEEINRLVTDRVSDLLLTPSADADLNLINEGTEEGQIVRVGNVMIDTLFHQLRQAEESSIMQKLECKASEYGVLTLHRPSNVDDSDVLRRVLLTIGKISEKLPIIFPVHPRTRAKISEFQIELPETIKLIDPLGYRDFLKLWKNSRIVLTDSGGLQEETTALGIPCITLRENTERPITITEGTNQLVGRDPEKIHAAFRKALSAEFDQCKRIPDLWDGQAAERIVSALINYR